MLPPKTRSSWTPFTETVSGPALRARRPIAKTAGSPAPASMPMTTIFHSACRLIHVFMTGASAFLSLRCCRFP